MAVQMDNILQRHVELNDLMQHGELTEYEHKEIIGILDELEQADATRMLMLIELAKIRGVAVDMLMKQLNIVAPKPRLDNEQNSIY